MSPQAFENCIKHGGRVRTKTLSDGRYIHICYVGNKSYAGEVKDKQDGSRLKAVIKGSK